MKKQLLLLSLLFSTLLVQPATGPERLLALLQSINAGTKTTRKTPTSVTAVASLTGVTTPPPPPTLSLSRASSTNSTTSGDSNSGDSSSSTPATPRPPSTVTVSDDDNYGSAAHWFQSNDDTTTAPPAPPIGGMPPAPPMGGMPPLPPPGGTATTIALTTQADGELIISSENLKALFAGASLTVDGKPLSLGTATSSSSKKKKKKKPVRGKVGGDLLAAIRGGTGLKKTTTVDKSGPMLPGTSTAKPQKGSLLDALKAAKGKAGGNKKRKNPYPKISDDGNSISFKITKVADLEKGRISESDAAKYKAMTRFTIEESTKKPKKGSAYQVIKLTLTAGKKWPSEFAPLVGASSAATTSDKPLSMAEAMADAMAKRAQSMAGGAIKTKDDS